MARSKDMNTLYLFPTEGEAAGLLSQHPELSGRVFITGVGMAQAGASAAALIAEHKPHRVVLCGIAGSMDRGLIHLGDVVQVVRDRVAGLPAEYGINYTSPAIEGVDFYVNALTVNRVGEAMEDEWVADTLQFFIEQMEGAAVAAVCRAFGVEYLHLRSISNYVDAPRSEWDVEGAVKALHKALARLNL